MNKNINSLYRKYRPQQFSDVIAQKHVTQTLENQIANGSVTHAYLFSGTRGTGKTTVAKIFARLVSQSSDSLVPDAGFDIHEIDAASNNRVEDVRDLIEKTKYPPTLSKYKVYIIDEVHMFSSSAFNAFLKTLEEPPSHVIFILCTTEPQKLPQTILSRVLRFDFRPVSLENLELHITNIFEKENIMADKHAIAKIARAGKGSFRDTLSVAEAVSAYSKNITATDVDEVLGTVSEETLRELLNAIFTKDAQKSMDVCNVIFKNSLNLGAVISDLLSIMKNAFIAKANPAIGSIFGVFAKLEQTIKTATDARTMFETAVLLAQAT